MRIYTIHMPPPITGRGRDAVAIREGFNVWAFLFSGLWAFAHRMWLVGIAIIAVTAAIAGALDYVGMGEAAEAVITLAAGVVIGASANDWRRAHLARKGWREVAVIAATDADVALRRYLDFAAIGAVPA
jgi:hypothetical protein